LTNLVPGWTMRSTRVIAPRHFPYHAATLYRLDLTPSTPRQTGRCPCHIFLFGESESIPRHPANPNPSRATTGNVAPSPSHDRTKTGRDRPVQGVGAPPCGPRRYRQLPADLGIRLAKEGCAGPEDEAGPRAPGPSHPREFGLQNVACAMSGAMATETTTQPQG
jgi:hypothetical protein